MIYQFIKKFLVKFKYSDHCFDVSGNFIDNTSQNKTTCANDAVLNILELKIK
jgi:hypothetical protein